MSDTGAVERAAIQRAWGDYLGRLIDAELDRTGQWVRPSVADRVRRQERRRSFEAGYRAALAAVAPTVEESRDLLARHNIGEWDGEGRYWCPCEGLGADVLVFATREDAIDHQAEQVAALWGAR